MSKVKKVHCSQSLLQVTSGPQTHPMSQSKLSSVDKKVPVFFIKNKNVTQDSVDNLQKQEKKPANIHILAAKKIFKNAVRRNRARRRIKEAWRQVYSINSSSARLNGPKMKISANIGSLDVPFSELKRIIKKEIEK